jgi:hypothetical protein
MLFREASMRAYSFVLRFITAASLCAAGAISVEARTWTNHEGKEIEAEYVRLDGLKVILLMNGKEFAVPLVNLSDADKQFVFEQQLAASTPKKPAPAAGRQKTEEADAAAEASEAPSRSAASSRTEDPKDGVARIRSWKDDKGNTIRAKFVRIHEGNVILMQGRKTVPCPIENLSAEDQDYLRQFLTARGEGHLTFDAFGRPVGRAAQRVGGRTGLRGRRLRRAAGSISGRRRCRRGGRCRRGADPLFR